MKLKDIIFPVIAAILPVGVYELVTYELEKTDFNFTVMLLAGVTSFILLVAISSFLEFALNGLNKYRGQWVEEMTLIEDESKYIAIGIIQYDRKTNEHIFVGKTYTLTGEEKYSWSIDYLRPNKDITMQYICGVNNPHEISIGQITFANKNECVGNIWIMNGKAYRYNAYRITKELVCKIDFSKPTGHFFKWPFTKSIMISQKDCPGFVRQYSERFFK